MTKNWWKLGISGSSIITSLVSLLLFRKFNEETRRVDAQIEALLQNKPEIDWPMVSVLVPARNEAENIEQCLEAILQQDYPNFELIAIDDNSTDQTRNILQELAEKAGNRLRIVQAAELPNGWLGKPHALCEGYYQINPQAQWLLFVDADTRLEAGALRGALSYAREKELSLLSLSPGLNLGSFWHQLLLAEMGKLYSFATLNFLRPPRPGSIEAGSANGAFILVCRKIYAQVGGHSALKNEVLEDVALAQNFRRAGYTTFSSYRSNYLSQRPGGGLAAFWESISKNWFLVARRRWTRALFVLVFESCYCLLPLLMLLASFFGKKESSLSKALNVTAVGFSILLYNEMLQIYRAPRHYALLYPVAAVLDTLIVLHSVYKVGVQQSISWKDRQVKIEFK